jgi:penicillin-binding protein A
MIPGRSGLRRHIAGAGRTFLLLFAIMSIALPYWMIARAPDLEAHANNTRMLEADANTLRGQILDSNGVVLAHSQMQADGTIKRFYAIQALAHVTGYWSLRFGVSGIEAVRNDTLRGAANQSLQTALLDTLLHRPLAGDDVVLTIDSRIQKAADDALGAEPGAIVVLDVRSGAVVALASHPYFDPNTLDANVEKLKADSGDPLLNRATQGLYPPGSTFKTVTLAAALEAGSVTASTTFTYTLHPPDAQHHGWWHVSDEGFECQNHASNNSPFDLKGAYIWSCNVAFGDIALKVGPDMYNQMAKRFGIGRPIPFDLPVILSQLYRTPDYFSGQERFYALAATGFGQGEISVTPLQMALVAAAVANDGKMPQPYLVARAQSPSGRTYDVTRPQILGTVMSPGTAATIRELMVASVDQGWAQTAKIPGVEVGGKTGTAEISAQGDPHSWFIGFAPGDSPRYAIAVVMERAGFGSAQAAPAAKKIIQALLQGQ